MSAADDRTPQDITGAEYVQILVRSDGKTVWINVDGVCLLRISRIAAIQVDDEREAP